MGTRNSIRKIDKARYNERFKNRCTNRARPELDAPIEPLRVENLVAFDHVIQQKKYKYIPQKVTGKYKDQTLTYYDYTYIKDRRGDNVFGMELNGPDHDIYFKELD